MKLVVVFGLPGSGKSFFAARLARKLESTHVNTDIIRKTYTPNPEYSVEEKESVYIEMLRRMELAVKEEKSLVLDATFHLEKSRAPFIELARKLNVILKFIEIRATEATIVSRLQIPRPDSDADFEVYQKLKLQAEPLDAPHLTLYSDQIAVEEMLSLAIAYLL